MFQPVTEGCDVICRERCVTLGHISVCVCVCLSSAFAVSRMSCPPCCYCGVVSLPGATPKRPLPLCQVPLSLSLLLTATHTHTRTQTHRAPMPAWTQWESVQHRPVTWLKIPLLGSQTWRLYCNNSVAALWSTKIALWCEMLMHHTAQRMWLVWDSEDVIPMSNSNDTVGFFNCTAVKRLWSCLVYSLSSWDVQLFHDVHKHLNLNSHHYNSSNRVYEPFKADLTLCVYTAN